MLYTVMPMEQVLQGIEKQPEFFEMKWQGRTILVQQVDHTTIRIERLLKGENIQDFLNPSFSPGTLLSILEIKEWR